MSPKMVPLEVCLDANVLISCLTKEMNRDVCRELLNRLHRRQACFYEPALILFEVTSCLQRKVFQKEITMKEQTKILDLFWRFPFLLQWQPHLLEKASLLASELKFKNIYDMSYLAVAISRGIACITLDQEFYTRAKKVYTKVYTVEGYLNS